MKTATLLHIDDCPNWETTERLLTGLSSELGFEVETRLITTAREAARAGFRGSPTVLIDGVDPFADDRAPVGLACRVYATPEGLRGYPTLDMLRAALTS